MACSISKKESIVSKNISLTHSLLLLLLLAPSALLSMEENPLEQSVMMPKEKGLGFLNTIFYYASDDDQVLNAVIHNLETGAFDATNGSNIKLLNEAFKTACQTKDKKEAAEIILTIAKLCNENEKYATVRISDNDVAQQGLELVNQFYLSELKLAQDQQSEREQWDQQKIKIFDCIKRIHEAVSSYDQTMKNNKSHDLEDVTKKVKSFKLLNRTVRTPIDDLLKHNKLQEPKTTILSPTTNQTPNELASVIINLNQTIQEIGPKQRIILALDQK